MPKYIDVTPSPKAYANMLKVIIKDTTNEADRAWAADELERIAPALVTGEWASDAPTLEGESDD